VDWSERLQQIDRRWIYLFIIVIVSIAILRPLGLPVRITDTTRMLYDHIESLPPGSVVWLGMEYSTGSIAELNPQIIAVVHHIFKKDLKLIVSGMWQDGPMIAQKLIEPLAEKYGKEYGVDWVNLGFRAGGTPYIRLMTEDIMEATAGVDHFSKPLKDYPLMQQVPRLTKEYVDFIIVADTGTPGSPEWLAYVSDPQGIPMGVCIIQMSVPGMMPYVQAGQYVGLVPGLRGAAEYEILVGETGPAVTGTDTSSMAAILVTLFIILGNIGYVMSVRRKEQE